MNKTTNRERIKFDHIADMEVQYTPSPDVIKLQKTDHLNTIKPQLYLAIDGDAGLVAAVMKKYNISTYCSHQADDGKHLDQYTDNLFDIVTYGADTNEAELYRIVKPGGCAVPNAIIRQQMQFNADTEYEHECMYKVGFTYKWPVFIKPADNTIHPFIGRSLAKDSPEEPYYAGSDTINVIHWGQRKLFLGEVEFLTKFYTAFPDAVDKAVACLYVGSAPGVHLKLLMDMFQRVKFILYDPNPFDKSIVDRAEIHNALFGAADIDDVLAKQYDHLLFISDIRNNGVEGVDDELVSELVQVDQALQMEWYHELAPTLTMFKFRLPWGDGETEYLDGEVQIQAYAPITSTETRLIVPADADIVAYDNGRYERQMAYFNRRQRPLKYQWPVSCEAYRGSAKIDMIDDYDGAAELHILDAYVQLARKLQPAKNITDLISGLDDGAAVFALSAEFTTSGRYKRRLNDEYHPLSGNKHAVLARAIAGGFAPPQSAPHNKNYNLYVVPNYGLLVPERQTS